MCIILFYLSSICYSTHCFLNLGSYIVSNMATQFYSRFIGRQIGHAGLTGNGILSQGFLPDYWKTRLERTADRNLYRPSEPHPVGTGTRAGFRPGGKGHSSGIRAKKMIGRGAPAKQVVHVSHVDLANDFLADFFLTLLDHTTTAIVHIRTWPFTGSASLY